MRLLVCGPGQNARLLAKFLRGYRHKVDTASSGVEAADMVNTFHLDLVISVDPEGVITPKLLPVCLGKTGVIALCDERMAIIGMLEAGADDAMSSDVHPEELNARVRTVVRRRNGWFSDLIEAGDIAVDLAVRRVMVKGREVPLGEREYDMIERLALRRGRATSKTMMLDYLYDTRADPPHEKVLSVLICRIRKVLTTNGAPNAITTSWGSGYALA